ncbi:MAG: hypothetical protein VKS61_02500 [Candidatus Sericytochromatia bacterium]|nr:hypothetical protein [Candidatus Sericytochromatia bacterium]
MPALDADEWLAAVMADEGWQAPLAEASRLAIVARLEALLPPGTTIASDEGDRLRAALRELATLAERLAAGTLDEAALVGAWSRSLRA